MSDKEQLRKDVYEGKYNLELQDLIDKGLVEMAYDEETGDFVFGLTPLGHKIAEEHDDSELSFMLQ